MKIPLIKDRVLILFTGEYKKAVPRQLKYDIEYLAEQCDHGKYFDCMDLKKILLGLCNKNEGL